MNISSAPASRRDGMRAALGRLFGRARSHRLAFALDPSRLETQETLAFSPSVRSGGMTLVAPSYRWSVPQADVGGGDVNLAYITANVSENESHFSTRIQEMTLPAPQRVTATRTDWPVASPTASVFLQWRGGRSKRTLFKLERLQAHSAELLSPRLGRARDGMAWFTRHIPLLRERLPVEAEEVGTPSAARARLAAASGADEEDIMVAGIYPRVPLMLVRQMALADGGRTLHLWLNSSAGCRSARLWTVTLGRLRSSGRTVQTIVEDKSESVSA